MRILVTGGAGFIGSHLVEFYLNRGNTVIAVDNLSSGLLKNIEPFLKNPNFSFEHADLLTWENLDKVIEKTDLIYHFSATVGIFKVISDRLKVIQNNIIACDRLFNAIANSKSRPLVIVACSSSAYGNSPKSPLNEKDELIVKVPTHLLATYAISKIADEAIAIAYNQAYNIPIILTRLFNTIGPRQRGHYGMVVPRFVEQACEGKPFTIFGDGSQTRSFCDVRDVVVALNLLANEPKAIGEIINVGRSDEITINDLAKLVSECLGKPNPSEFVPYEKAYGSTYTDISQRRPDLTKLHSLVHFDYQWTLAETINDLIKRYQASR